MEYESDNYTNRDWCFCCSHQRINKGTVEFGNKAGGDHPNYCIFENGQNTEKNPEDLRRTTVTQNPVKDHKLTLI